MRAKTRPDECNHVYCRACISAWTNTFSNLCPLCKVEIKVLLIYRERPDPDEEANMIEAGDYDPRVYEEVVERIAVTKPVINNEISDWV